MSGAAFLASAARLRQIGPNPEALTMLPTLYGIPNCDTVKKARVWLDQHGQAYAFHDYKKAGIDRETLESWVKAHGWEIVLNRAGTTFRALPPEDKADLTADKAIGLMIKRPVLDVDGRTTVGFKPEIYAAVFA
jgi:arsenate reductase